MAINIWIINISHASARASSGNACSARVKYVFSALLTCYCWRFRCRTINKNMMNLLAYISISFQRRQIDGPQPRGVSMQIGLNYNQNTRLGHLYEDLLISEIKLKSFRVHSPHSRFNPISKESKHQSKECFRCLSSFESKNQINWNQVRSDI